MKLSHLLARADESLFQDLIGADTVRLLHLLDPSLVTPGKLRELVELRHPPTALLRDPQKRAAIIDTLPTTEALALCERLGEPSKDAPHEQLRQLRFRRGSQREKTFLEFFGVALENEDAVTPSPSAYRVTPNYGLFAHQRAVARRALECLETHPRRALIHMPTGAGKTRTTMHVVAQYLREVPQGVVVWLAHSEELCYQAAKELEDAWRALGDRGVEVLRFWGNSDADPSLLKDGVLVTAVPKLHQLALRDLGVIGQLASGTVLVVIDEGHKATAPTYKDLLEVLLGADESAGLLGLTATPGRSWDDISQDKELARLFNYERVPLEVTGYDNPVNYLVDEGYLARATFRPLYPSGRTELTEPDRISIEQKLDIPSAVLRRLADDEQRTLLIIHTVEELAQRHDRILVFSTTVAHAHVLAAVLTARGKEAYAITGDTPGSERQRALQRYTAGSAGPIILTNYGVLTSGFDAPKTSAGVIARPTKSLVLYSQMVGRMMRGPRASGNPECEIVTVVDRAIPGFSDMADAFVHWNDVWGETTND